MKQLFLLAALGAICPPGVLGHNTQGILLVNGTETPTWKYVRKVAPEFDDTYYPEGSDYPKVGPQMDLTNANITCGRNAFDAAANTETADVLAGSEVGFRVSWDGNGPYGFFWHQGPAQIYLSRAPNDDLEQYRGDGDWFKIAYGGPVNNNEWLLWWKPDFNFTIPQATPPGKYLMRIEQFFPTDSYNYTQWYVNCAHINVIGDGGGTPAGFARFPGTYSIDHPGIRVPRNQMVRGHVKDEDMRLLEYQPPGPEVWRG